MKTNKVVLVTGANKGLGFAISRQLAEAGMKVILTARSREKGTAAVERLQSEKSDIVFKQLDVTDNTSIKNCSSFISKEYGTLDVLINNAGISGSRKGIPDAPMEEIEKVMNTNCYGAITITRALYPLLKKSEDPRVINMSSKMGSFDELKGDYAAYRLSKAGLNAATVMFANDFETNGVKVNAMHPGWVKTDMGGPNATRTPGEGADTAIWLATTENVPTGKFFFDRKEISW